MKKKKLDNAKYFVRAKREIKKFHEMVRKPDDQIAGYLAAEGIESIDHYSTEIP